VIFGKGKKMKTSRTIILVWIIATAVVIANPLSCKAMGATEEKNLSQDRPSWWQRWFEPTDKAIERMMNRLKETDPNKAQELEKLREQDPEKFKTELRETMRQHLGKRHREGMEQRFEGEFPRRGMFRGPEECERPYREQTRMPERFGEHHKWLERNYPEQAERLDALKEERPQLYRQYMDRSLKRYGRILDAEAENPQLAKVLKEDLELKQKQEELLRGISSVSENEKKAKLTEELKGVVSDRFDLIVKRKQLEYEHLSDKLQKLEEKVKKSQAEVEKWKDAKFKNDSVEARVKELVSETEKFEWE
jgi:hypothetical protein